MIQFLIRLCIVGCGVIVVGVMNGLYGLPFFGAILFACTWLIYRPFEVIANWLIFFLMILVIFFHQNAFLYLIAGIGSLYTFDIIHAYLVRNNNAKKVILFLIMVIFSVATIGVVHILTRTMLSISNFMDITAFIGALIIFFIASVSISYAESFIGLYVHSDQRCHT
jgi:hypothetical protein